MEGKIVESVDIIFLAMYWFITGKTGIVLIVVCVFVHVAG